eukprot:SAG11_NODE_3081_length_2708_cov_14.190111_1_plen_153_part_00
MSNSLYHVRSATKHAQNYPAGKWFKDHGRWIFRTADDQDTEQHRPAARCKQLLALARIAEAFGAGESFPGSICDDLAREVGARVQIPGTVLSGRIKAETKAGLPATLRPTHPCDRAQARADPPAASCGYGTARARTHSYGYARISTRVATSN